MIVGIAIDGSSHAKRAFDYYMNDCHKKDNEVLLLHVLHGPVSASLAKKDVSHVYDKVIKEAQTLQQHYETKLAELGVSGKWLSIPDDKKIGEAIVHAVEEHNVQLVVIGSRGVGVIRRTFLGSVSDYVLHHVKVPVIVCRPEGRHEHENYLHFQVGPPIP